jgi:hypothetical protein
MKREREGKQVRIHACDMDHFRVKIYRLLPRRIKITNALNSVEEVVLKNKNTWTQEHEEVDWRIIQKQTLKGSDDGV